MTEPARSIFELTIQPTKAEAEHRIVAQWHRPDGMPTRRSVDVRIDEPALLEHASPAAYGEALGRMVFVGGVRELFAQARADPAGIRVLLGVEAKALQSVRWERLAGPFEDDRWLMLGQTQRTPFSLHLPSGSDQGFLPFGRKELRALVVIASPEPDNDYGVAPFDEAKALDTVLEGLGEIPALVLGKDPRAEGPPTLDEIRRRLTAERFTLLHVVCHGAYSKRTAGETAVFLDAEGGGTEAVTASTMILRFRELDARRGLPHLAFLAVCDSAKPEAEGALGGLAQRLVRELGLPAVVAMTERVSQATVLTLSRAFYERLRAHGEIDRALAEASVDVRERHDVVVPVLFSRIAGRPLFDDGLDLEPTPELTPSTSVTEPPSRTPPWVWLGAAALLVAAAGLAFAFAGNPPTEPTKGPVAVAPSPGPATTAADASSTAETKPEPGSTGTTAETASESTGGSTGGDTTGGTKPNDEPIKKSRPPRAKRCQDHDLTVRAIKPVLSGRCKRAKVEVHGGLLDVPSLGIKDRRIGGSLPNCKGEIKCSD